MNCNDTNNDRSNIKNRLTIGVLALQGAFREHIEILNTLAGNGSSGKPGIKGGTFDIIEVRTASELMEVDGLILPGGESTAIGKLLVEFNMKELLIEKINSGLPVFGTCAGMILLAKKLSNDDRVHLATMDIVVRRNAYGRQLGSFYTEAKMKGVADNVKMTFIRAPFIEALNDNPNVEVLAEVDGNMVAARQDNMLAVSFHPELIGETGVHRYFLEEMVESTENAVQETTYTVHRSLDGKIS